MSAGAPTFLCSACGRAVPRTAPFAVDTAARLVGVEVCACGRSFGLTLTPEERVKFQDGWKPCARVQTPPPPCVVRRPQ